MVDFDKEILKLAEQSNGNIQRMYDEYYYQLSRLGVNAPDGGMFSFEKDVPPSVRKKVQQLTDEFHNNLLDELRNGIDFACGVSLMKHTELLNSIQETLKGLNLHQPRREEARKEFVEQRMKPDGKMSLSDRVWNFANQGKAEVEAAISLAVEDGVTQGKTAAELGREVRKYLNDPDRMYRRYHRKKVLSDGSKVDEVVWKKRVIGEDGKTHFVDCELEHPGQGVYLSARANAERCSRSEINTAYRYADYERWNEEPFVLGYRISLSNNHTTLAWVKGVHKAIPLTDICDDLKGDYPKTFKFCGWHPHCRCHMTPILASEDDMDAWLEQGCPDGFFDSKYIKETPHQLNEWMEENGERVKTAKSVPYWIQDNFMVKKNSIKQKEMEVIEPKVYNRDVTPINENREFYKGSPISRDVRDVQQTSNASTSVVDVMSDYLDKKNAEVLSSIKQYNESTRSRITDISIDNTTISKLMALGIPMSSRAETIAKRKELVEWMKSSDLFVSKSIMFDDETGTLFAMHKGHKLDKFKNEYFGNSVSPNRLELELADSLLDGMKSGRCVVMLNESVVVGNDVCAALDLFVDGVFADIKSITQYEASIINALSSKSHQIGGFARSRKIKSDTLILYYHDKSMYDKNKFDDAIKEYQTSNVIKKHIKHIYVVTKDGSVSVVHI